MNKGAVISQAMKVIVYAFSQELGMNKRQAIKLENLIMTTDLATLTVEKMYEIIQAVERNKQ